MGLIGPPPVFKCSGGGSGEGSCSGGEGSYSGGEGSGWEGSDGEAWGGGESMPKGHTCFPLATVQPPTPLLRGSDSTAHGSCNKKEKWGPPPARKGD